MIEVLDEQGVNFEIQVIRFFEYNGNQYLIYTNNEKDEAGYVKLFLSKNENGFFVGVQDDNEWSKIKELIKVIVKEAKEGQLITAEDLDYFRIINQTILGAKPFKLTINVLEMLSANKKQFKKVEEVLHSDEPEQSDQDKFSFNAFDLEDDSEDAKSYEELLAQIKSFKDELPSDEKTLPKFEEESEPEELFEEVKEDFQTISFDKINYDLDKKVANINSLESLLDNEESDKLDLEDRVSKLERELAEANRFISKLKEILK